MAPIRIDPSESCVGDLRRCPGIVSAEASNRDHAHFSRKDSNFCVRSFHFAHVDLRNGRFGPNSHCRSRVVFNAAALRCG